MTSSLTPEKLWNFMLRQGYTAYRHSGIANDRESIKDKACNHDFISSDRKVWMKYAVFSIGGGACVEARVHHRDVDTGKLGWGYALDGFQIMHTARTFSEMVTLHFLLAEKAAVDEPGRSRVCRHR
jgi:hypothetical protein